MSLTRLRPDLIRAYTASSYRAGSVRFGIGRHSLETDALLEALGARQAVLLTAWNPRSTPMPHAWNLRADSTLRERLRGHVLLDGAGGKGRHEEAQILAVLPVARARVLARRFRQNAVVVLQRGRPARLVLLR
jgi:hypothetical protein